MNTDNINIEKLRKAWMEMGKALDMQNPLNYKPEDLSGKKTALDRLRDKYRVFWSISLIMAFVGFFIFSNGVLVVSHLNFWLGVAYAVYFLTAFCMDSWLWQGIGTIDLVRMNVTTVNHKTIFYRKRHLQFMAIIIPMAVALLGFTAYVYSAERSLLSGMICGTICGVVIGIIQFRRFMADYRKLLE